MRSATGTFREQMLDFYELTAHAYDSWSNGVHAKAASRLAELAAVRPGEVALDLGCGTGLVTHQLGARPAAGGLAIGVDVSLAALALARDQPGDAHFVAMDAERLALRRQRFDVVTMGQSLGFMGDPDAALGEARRVLRRGGRLAVSCQRRRLCTQAQQLFFAALSELAERHPVRVPRFREDHAVFGEPRVLTDMIRQSGFDDVRITQMVTGDRADGAHAWTELMMGAGPYPHALLSVLGPRPRAEFEKRLDEGMRDLGEGAYRYHHAFTFAVATRA